MDGHQHTNPIPSPSALPLLPVPQGFGEGARELVAGRADPAACQVPSCPARGSLPAESPPQPPSSSSWGHARPLAAGIAATALEKHQHTSALQGDACPLTWKGEQSREWWGSCRRGAQTPGALQGLGTPRASTGLWHTTLSILPRARLHSDLLQEPDHEGLRQDPGHGRWQKGPCHTGRSSTTAPGPPNLHCSSPAASPPISLCSGRSPRVLL